MLIKVIQFNLSDFLEEVLGEHKDEVLLHALPVDLEEDVSVLISDQKFYGADQVT